MLLLSIHLYRSKKILEDLAHLLMILQIQIYHLRCPWEVICPFQAPNHQDLLKNLTTEAVIPDQIVRAIQCYQHIQTNLPTITLEHKYLPVDNLLWIWEECNLQDMHRICQVIMAILIPLNQLQTILHIITILLLEAIAAIQVMELHLLLIRECTWILLLRWTSRWWDIIIQTWCQSIQIHLLFS